MKTYDSIIVTSNNEGVIKSWIGETKHAEHAFDNMVNEFIDDEFKNEIDYSFKHTKVQQYFKKQGMDIFWITEQEINVVY